MDSDSFSYLRLKRQLERAINDSLYYLGRYKSEQLINVIDMIDEMLDLAEDDVPESPYGEIERPYVEILRFLEPNFGKFVIPEDLQLKKQFDLYPIFALFKAIEGKHSLEQEKDFVRAAECCADAFEAMYSVLSIPVIAKIDRLSNRGKAGKQGRIKNDNEDREAILAELQRIIENNIYEETIDNLYQLDKKVTETMKYTFKKKNGGWKINSLAQYIYDKLFTSKEQKERNTVISLQIGAIRKTISMKLNNEAKLQAVLGHVIRKETDQI